MYLIQIDHLIYEKRDGSGFTLGEAWRELVGVGNCRILRITKAGTLVTVCRRGLNSSWVVGPTGGVTIRAACRHRRIRTAVVMFRGDAFRWVA